MNKEEVINIINIIGIKWILIYFLGMNLIGFLLMWIDKKKAEKSRWRISEKTLIMMTILGGSIGTNIGMKVFRHKTKKPRFYIGFPVILISQIALLIYLIIYLNI